MAAYVVGDVQGCYGALCRLLDKLKFDESRDELWLAGDLVNRGPESANVIRLAKSLPNIRVVLGNHDLNLLAVSTGFRQIKQTDSLEDVLKAPDSEELLSWVRQLPLLHFDPNRQCLMVHAGLHPNWSVEQGRSFARQVENLLRDDDTYPVLLERMYGDLPTRWSDCMDEFDKARWIINAFTRMRFCTADGEMDFTQVGPPGTQPLGLHPWFNMRSPAKPRIVFGHWSTLGAGMFDHVVSLDSGCVHGVLLTAINLDDEPLRFVQVACNENLPSPHFSTGSRMMAQHRCR